MAACEHQPLILLAVLDVEPADAAVACGPWGSQVGTEQGVNEP